MTLLGNLQTDKSLGRFLKLSYHYLPLPLPVILLFGNRDRDQKPAETITGKIKPMNSLEE